MLIGQSNTWHHIELRVEASWDPGLGPPAQRVVRVLRTICLSRPLVMPAAGAGGMSATRGARGGRCAARIATSTTPARHYSARPRHHFASAALRGNGGLLSVGQ